MLNKDMLNKNIIITDDNAEMVLLMALYNNGPHNDVDFKEFFGKQGFVFRSDGQENYIINLLEEKGFIDIKIPFEFGGGIGHISNSGIQKIKNFIETSDDKNLLNSTDGFYKTNSGINNDILIDRNYYLKAEAKDFKIYNEDVKPCFNVETLAGIFARHIDKMDVCGSQMIGIFGTWGRGKTYFWKKTKAELCKLGNIRYIPIEFNAWKYQETPAIWAYLDETLQNNLISCSLARSFFNIKSNFSRNMWKIVIDILFIMIFLSLVMFLPIIPQSPKDLSQTLKYVNILSYFKKGAWLMAIVAIGAYIFFKMGNVLIPAYSYIKTTLLGKDIIGYKGCKSEIEDDIKRLLKSKVHDSCKIKLESGKKKKVKEKVVLFIDDIDRCESGKMLSIIDSLRTILEDEVVSKKMIIICALDGKRLSSALFKEYSLLSAKNNKEEVKRLVREQMDKLFISGIKLRRIYYDEQIEYVKALINPNHAATSSLSNDNKQTLSNALELDPYNEVTSKDVSEQTKSRLAMFRKILNDTDASEITPRQLRIIYYRFLLANNLLSGHNVQQDMLAKSIYYRTLGREDVTKVGSLSLYDDVVDTVVCY